MVCLRRRRLHGALSSGRPWCVQYAGEHPLFEKALCCTVCLEVGGVDHGRAGRLAHCRQGGEDTVEHTRLAPSNETVIERLGRAIDGGRVAPHQTILQNMDNAADHAAVVDAPNTPYLVGQKRFMQSELCIQQPKMMTSHADLPVAGERE
jgi:hypothetical protein